jgi:hypothetical protein
MIGPIKRTFTQQTGTFGEVSIASWIFFDPKKVNASTLRVLFCLPGGGYTKAYYHMDSAGYSFACNMAERGFVVAIVDHLGTGDSTHPQDGRHVTAEAMAHANHQVVEQLRVLLSQGLIAGIKPSKLFFAGIGHSMGAMLGIIQQSMYQSFDSLAVLGWANGQMTRQVSETPLEIDGHGYGWVQRTKLFLFLYPYGVPDAIIEQDYTVATGIPLGAFAYVAEPSAMERSAAPIVCPIFIGNGTIDTAADLHAEAGFFPNSSDITLFRQHHAGHLHNFAPTRHVLWDRLAWWAHTCDYTTSEGAFS